MKQYLFTSILSVIICLSLQTNAQEKEQQNNSPQTTIEVTKEYDEEGKLVKFDSIFTQVSSVLADSVMVDSIFEQMHTHFDKHFPFEKDSIFEEAFKENPFKTKEFKEATEFFNSWFQENSPKMEQLFIQMDSVKNLLLEMMPKEEITEKE